MKHSRILYSTIILLASLFILWGCPKNAAVNSTPEAALKAQNGNQKPGANSGPGAEGGPIERSSTASSGIQPIYFDFNESFVRGDARQTMKTNAEWLRANPSVKVRIEGNCDERGTKEYNQSLGQRRALNAKKSLTDMGISAQRITLLSYGKEKPVCTESTEACWQKNRRDDFSVVN